MGWVVVPQAEVGTGEEEQVWGMLEVKGPWGGQGDLTWAMWRLRRCVPEAGRLEERDNMCKKGVGRGLKLSGEQRGAQLTLILQGTQNKEACG